MAKSLTEDDIPSGWRKLEPIEVKKYGDRFFVDGYWHKTGLLGQAAGSHMVFIRSLVSPLDDPNEFESITLNNLKSSAVKVQTSAEKVKEYLNKLNAKK